MSDEITVSLSESAFGAPGLYLLMPGGAHVDLTHATIEKVTAEYWSDTGRIPQEVRKAVDFQRCPFCPLSGTADICDAIRPILPFLNTLSSSVSYSEVTALYKGAEPGLYHVSRTSMQRALRSVSVLSLTEYCKYGAQYRKYFYGIMPFMSGRDIAIRMYENMFTALDGNREAVGALIRQFYNAITVTSRNQIKRLNLITRNDSFMNAFVSTQMITELLNMDVDKKVRELFTNP